MRIRQALAGTMIALVSAAIVSARAQRPAATLDDLLAEIRGLRADLNQSYNASIRTQLTVGRVEVQEQRVAATRRDLADTQFQLRIAVQQRERTLSTVTGLEEAIRSGNIAEQRTRQLEQELAPLQERLAREQQLENELRSREVDMANLLIAEQGRWSDVNSRLDELERALASPRR